MERVQWLIIDFGMNRDSWADPNKQPPPAAWPTTLKPLAGAYLSCLGPIYWRFFFMSTFAKCLISSFGLNFELNFEVDYEKMATQASCMATMLETSRF